MFVALIPAKGKSSRLKGKNFIHINKKPLIYFTLKFANQSKEIKRSYVSSDNQQILNYSKNHKMDIIKRPDNISQNNTPMNKVILHFIKYLKNKKIKPKTIILLQPTSPLRPKKLLDKLIKIYKRKKYTSLMTIKKIDKSNLKSLIRIKKNKYQPIYNKKYLYYNTQKLPDLFKLNGSIFIFETKEFLKNKMIPMNNCYFHILKGKYNLDIDTKDDLKLAKKIM